MRARTGVFGAAARAMGGLLMAAALMIPAAAQAQFSDAYNFLKAVKDRDGSKATELLEKPGSTVVNSKDGSTGQTALHVVTERRDATWLAFLLGKGAQPNVTDTNGNTPLMIATQLRWIDGMRLLITTGAMVDKPNDSGETPLIRAVQLRDLSMVRLLIAQGANPNKADTLAGMSAMDYAKRDGRTPGLIEALQQAKPARDPSAQVQGPQF